MRFLCPICGEPMVHSRLRGYHCHFETHNDQARNLHLPKLIELNEEEQRVWDAQPSVDTPADAGAAE